MDEARRWMTYRAIRMLDTVEQWMIIQEKVMLITIMTLAFVTEQQWIFGNGIWLTRSKAQEGCFMFEERAHLYGGVRQTL